MRSIDSNYLLMLIDSVLLPVPDLAVIFRVVMAHIFAIVVGKENVENAMIISICVSSLHDLIIFRHAKGAVRITLHPDHRDVARRVAVR